MGGVVIVGAGVAGVQTAQELRQRGYTGDVTVIGEETAEPYDRPPLSKEFLKGTADRGAIGLLPAHTAADRSIALRLGSRVTEIDGSAQTVLTDDGAVLDYDRLVLATGAINRALPVPGANLPGVWSLRTVDEAEGLRQTLSHAASVVIVGGGFIGLEVAAAARLRGARVTVVEYLPRVLARVLSPQMSERFAVEHRNQGVQILAGLGVGAISEGANGAASGVVLSDGTAIRADLVVVGVGVNPATDLAEAAGLAVSDGIIVDQHLRTNDPRIFAVGDCARFDCAISGRPLRLESIQNAADQARFVADQIVAETGTGETGNRPTYAALPWFWSEQFGLKLQIAGAAPADADSVVRGDPTSASFSVCRFVGDKLVAVESVNHTKDHLGARKLLANPASLATASRDALVDPTVPLKSLVASRLESGTT